ncbi:acyltransferase family protein [Roseivivax isoporae]|uniref:Acyltransferase 3 domain-containing protein n=1 Tax=Roseivivax isoporae LMG 25204 TaxID=1449351 RepID=X7F353_9RHOB|nr:acyltransferase [Roseivivax isoporae]ETX27235.1 hypothetical protein RISW2_15045 [Roseivivax isoporae LMG 25204]
MNRIHAIQYLRALAALAVVALHTGKRAAESLPEGAVLWLPLGNAGVDLFFVISGFIMWSIGHYTQPAPGPFLLRRAFRVAPPYWIATLAWLGLVTAAGYDWITVTAGHVAASLAFVPHYSPTFGDQVWPVLVPGWTLNYEMFFYLAFAACLFVPARHRLMALVGLLGTLVVLGALLAPRAAIAATYTSPLLLEFLGGCLVAALWLRAPGGIARNAAVLAAGIAVLLLFGRGVDPDDHAQRTLVWGTAGVLIVSGTLGLGTLIPRLPRLERLGDASYAIYLFHLLLVVPAAEVWQRLPQLHSAPGAALFVVLTMALVIWMGLAIFHYVERPLQRRLNGLVLGRQGAPAAAAPREAR